jgi:carboxyl-terminal processing protease
VKSATFVIEVKKPLDEAVPVRLEVGDKELYEAQREKMLLPTGPAIPTAGATLPVRVQADSVVVASAQEKGDRLAAVKKGAVLTAHGKAGAYWRVEWQKGRIGFLPVAAAKEAPGAKLNAKLVTQVMQSEAPSIRLANLDTSRGGVDTDQDHLSIAGSAADPNGMRDLQIFVQHENDYRKVFFRTARKPGQTSGGQTQLDFQADLPLKPGNSTVVIVAREDDDLPATRTVVVHRKQPVVAQQQQERPRAQR